MTAREEAIWCATFAAAFVGRKDFYNVAILPAAAEDAHHALIMADRAVAAFRSVEEFDRRQRGQDPGDGQRKGRALVKVIVRKDGSVHADLLAAFRAGEERLWEGRRCLVHGYREVADGLLPEVEWTLFLIGVPRCMQTGEHVPAPIEESVLGDPWRTIRCAWCREIVEERRWDADL